MLLWKHSCQVKRGKIRCCGRPAEARRRRPDRAELQPRCWAYESLKVAGWAAQAIAGLEVARLDWAITWWLHCQWGVMAMFWKLIFPFPLKQSIASSFFIGLSTSYLTFWKQQETVERGRKARILVLSSLLSDLVHVTSRRSSYL